MSPVRARYKTLIAAGKPFKVALVGIMRNLIILANALLRNGRAWAPRKRPSWGLFAGGGTGCVRLNQLFGSVKGVPLFRPGLGAEAGRAQRRSMVAEGHRAAT